MYCLLHLTTKYLLSVLIIDGVLGFGHRNEVKEVTEIPELNAMNIKEFYNGLNFVIAVNNQNNVLFGWGGIIRTIGKRV